MKMKILTLLAGLSASALSLAAAQPTIGYNAAALTPIEMATFEDKLAGSFYSAPTANGDRKPVVFVGNDVDGLPVSFPLNGKLDVGGQTSYSSTLKKCQALGPGWVLPSLHNLKMFHPYAYQAEPEFRPGQFWSSTAYECKNCPGEPRFTYNVKLGGNVKQSSAVEFFPAFGICAYKGKGDR